MYILTAVLCLLASPVLLVAQQPGLTPNTLAFDSTQARPVATVADLAWLAGHWRGRALGGISEEVWSAPAANSMMGMYRLMKDGDVAFYEILSIQLTANEAFFEGMTFRRLDRDRIVVQVAMEHQDGSATEAEFPYTRVKQ